MSAYLILALAVVGTVVADDSGYAAPAAASGYGAPAQSYGAPADTYEQPSYAPSAPSYNEPQGYADYSDEGTDLFKLDKIVELIPFFLAVFAAIIVAQLFAPLLGMLFDAKLGLLAPFGCAKRDLINLVLAPLNLAICDITDPAAPTTECPAMKRSLASGFFSDSNTINIAQTLFDAAMERKYLLF